MHYLYCTELHKCERGVRSCTDAQYLAKPHGPDCSDCVRQVEQSRHDMRMMATMHHGSDSDEEDY